MSALALGVDIGGTKVAFAVTDRAGHVIDRGRMPTVHHGDPAGFVDAITPEINCWLEKYPAIVGVGVGCPGLVDPVRGYVERAFIMQWQDYPIIPKIAGKLARRVPVHIGNDVKCLALGEKEYGAGQDCDHFVLLAIGTGLGAAAISHGVMVYGAHNAALEIGHIAVVPDGRLCHCGKVGCLEMYVSGRGLAKSIQDYLPDYPTSALTQKSPATNHDLIALMGTGDPLADRILTEFTDHLGQLLTWCCAMLNPQRILLGGGVGRAIAPHVTDVLQAQLDAFDLYGPERAARLLPAQIADSAVGASALVWQ